MFEKIWKYVSEPYRILLKLDNMRIITLDDKKFLQYRGLAQIKTKMNIDNPKTFNEKLQWLKIHDRKDEYCKMVDKYEVRKYIKEKIGSEYLIPLIGVYNSFDEINFNDLPNRFVIKCTHDSASVIICKNKEKLDVENARLKIEKALKTNYFYLGREWPYKNIEPRIIIEEYMEDKKRKELVDYKLMCFNGEPLYTFVYSGRFSSSGVKASFYDINFNVLNFKRKFGDNKKDVEKPLNYDKMIEFSRILSKNIPFLRVDWYEINGKLYFGELTFYPASGYGEFEPVEWDYKLGDMIDLSKVEVKNEK